MAYWEIRTETDAVLEWGSGVVHAVLSSPEGTVTYLMEGDESDLRALRARYPTLEVRRAKDGPYVDQRTDTTIWLSQTGTQLERTPHEPAA
jgi:hypothetical protein